MKISAVVDLDDIFTGDGWDTQMVSEVIKDEIRKIVASEVRKSLKNNKELQALINKAKSVAIKRALDGVKGLE